MDVNSLKDLKLTQNQLLWVCYNFTQDVHWEQDGNYRFVESEELNVQLIYNERDKKYAILTWEDES